jgi:hypothetical protein
MSETGCLKDGHFHNLEASSIMLGTNSLVAPIEQKGLITIDAGDGSEADVTLTNADAGRIYIFTTDLSNSAKAVNLPALSTMNIGDQILFIVATTMASATATIVCPDGTKIIGTVGLANGDVDGGTSISFKTIGTGPAKTNIVLTGATTDNAAGAAGTKILLTVVGAKSNWLVSGMAMTADVDATCTGAGLFT